MHAAWQLRRSCWRRRSAMRPLRLEHGQVWALAKLACVAHTPCTPQTQNLANLTYLLTSRDRKHKGGSTSQQEAVHPISDRRPEGRLARAARCARLTRSAAGAGLEADWALERAQQGRSTRAPDLLGLFWVPIQVSKHVLKHLVFKLMCSQPPRCSSRASAASAPTTRTSSSSIAPSRSSWEPMELARRWVQPPRHYEGRGRAQGVRHAHAVVQQPLRLRFLRATHYAPSPAPVGLSPFFIPSMITDGD